ncbi:MAG: beta strand repeat-containing protein, partial [Planctomycetota bacterium]
MNRFSLLLLHRTSTGRGFRHLWALLIVLGLGMAGAMSSPAHAANVSGTVYLDEGVTDAGNNRTVRLIVNGVDAGSDVTNANGDYSVTGVTLSAGDAMLVYIDGEQIDGTTVTVSDGNNLSGFDIWEDHVIVRHDNGGSLSITDMDTAKGAFSDAEIEYSVSAGALTVPSPNELYVPAGVTFAPGGDVSAYDVKILGTLDGGANTLSVEANWDASTGTFTAGTSTVEFTDNSAIFTPGASAYNNVTLSLGNGGQILTLGSALDLDGNLTINNGGLDVSASNYAITVAGDFTNQDIFTARSGTVTLDGTGQTISGTTTFFNLTKSVAVADTLTFEAGSTTGIDGTVTLNGAAGNRLSLRSSTPGSRWNIGVSAGATKAIDYVDVQDSSANPSHSSQQPIGPTNSINSGNNIEWFERTITGTVYTDEGVTAAGNNLTVRLIVNGVDQGTDTTDGSGFYSITAELNGGDAILVYLDGAAIDGTTVTVSDGNDLSGLDIWADHVITRHDNGGSLTNVDMDTAKGGFSDAEIEYSVSAGALTVPSPNELYVPAGVTFAPGGDVTAYDVKILGTLDGGANTITVQDDWDASAGTFTAGTSTVTFTLASATFTPGASVYNNVTVNLTTANTLTLGSALDVDGDLNITTGVLDVSASNYAITVAGDFTNLGTFTARSGTVTLDGTGQTISGSTTF